jgi:hypothetical protein
MTLPLDECALGEALRIIAVAMILLTITAAKAAALYAPALSAPSAQEIASSPFLAQLSASSGNEPTGWVTAISSATATAAKAMLNPTKTSI